MLYMLLYPLHASYAPLNVFRYITFRTLLAGLTALSISLLLGPALIRRLAALQIGQSIRSDGPAAHATKAGTPTMGGTLILFALLLATLLLADLNDWYVWVAVTTTPRSDGGTPRGCPAGCACCASSPSAAWRPRCSTSNPATVDTSPCRSSRR
jgi:hypothetical protein